MAIKKVWTVTFQSKTHSYGREELCVRATTAGRAETKAGRIARKALADYVGGSKGFRVIGVEHTLDLND